MTPSPTSSAFAASARPPRTPVTDTIESLTISIAHIPAGLTPVTSSIPVVSAVVASGTQAIERIPVALAPTFQVMAAVEGAMTSVVQGGIPLTPQPEGLAALLGAPAHQVGTDRRSVPAYPATQADLVRVAPQTSKVDVPSRPEPAGKLTSRPVSSGSMPGTAPQTTPPSTAQADSWVRSLPGQIAHAIREAVQNVSLTDLALAALPGLAALLGFFAAGVGIGHRQARYRFAMQMTDILRFAPNGPLGVVRSGSFVAVRPGTARTTVRREPEKYLRRLDQAG